MTMTTEAEPVAETTVDPTCGACGALLRDMAEFHPHSFCVLVKAGYDPLSVVLEAIDYLNENAKGWAKVTDVKPDGG